MNNLFRLLREEKHFYVLKRVYSCPCGKGLIKEEQDYTPGHRDGFASLHCHQCEKNYCVDFGNSQTKWSLKKKNLKGEELMINTIKQIVFEEFSKVVANIESDFRFNYVRKRYNFLLSQLDENMTANMVFVNGVVAIFLLLIQEDGL